MWLYINILEKCAFSFLSFPFNQTEPQQLVAGYTSYIINYEVITSYIRRYKAQRMTAQGLPP